VFVFSYSAACALLSASSALLLRSLSFTPARVKNSSMVALILTKRSENWGGGREEVEKRRREENGVREG